MEMEQNHTRLEHRKGFMRAFPGKIQPPLKRCFKFELINTPIFKPNYMGDIINGLKACDSELRLYYDAATAGGSDKPGWHVYRCYGGTMGSAHEKLFHVFGVMQTMSETLDDGTWNLIQWPDGKPCMPTMAVVEEYKRRWHRHCNPHEYKTLEEMADAVKKANREGMMEAIRGDGDGLKQDWETFKNTPGLAHKIKSKQKFEKNKTPTTKVKVIENVGTVGT